MRFGCQTIVWGRRIDDLELVLDVISACGFVGVEVHQEPDDIYVRDPSADHGHHRLRDIEELSALCQANGRHLTLLGIGGGTLRERMDFLKDFRPEYLCIEGWGPDAEEAVNRIAPFTLALHPHWLTPICRTDQARKILEEHPQKDSNGRHLLRLVADTAHLTIVDDNPVEVVREFAGRLAAVHLKDWTPCIGRFSRRYLQGFVALGKGFVGLSDVLAELTALDYGGWVVVEQDCPETTAARSVLTNAEWLAQRNYLSKPDGERLARLLKPTAEQPARKTSHNAAPRRELLLLNSILPAAVRDVTPFYQAVVDSFCSLDGIAAATLYSYCKRNDQLYLLAISGLDGSSCDRILSGTNSLCGTVTHDPHVATFDLTDSTLARQFSDSQLLDRLPQKRMITVPIFNPANPHHLLYLLNLFPKTQSFSGDADELAKLGAHVGRAAGFVVDEVCSAVALQTSHLCGKSKTLKDFLERLVQLVQRAFDCEGTSVFLVNRAGNRLELAHSTGVEWDPKLRSHELYYPKGLGLTGRTWATGDIAFEINARRAKDHQRRSWEKRPSSDRDECLFAPLARLGGAVVGIVRLVNKRVKTSERASTMFTDDDAAVLDSIIQAALPHLELLQQQQRQVEIMARMTHEFQVPMVASRAAVQFMQKALERKGLLARELFGQDYLNDVLEWSGLMGRLAHNAKLFGASAQEVDLRLTKTLLKSEVVAPAVNQVGLLLKNRRFERESIHYADFGDLPPLWIDKNQFQQVFFNLLSNSIKYADPRLLRVEITAGQTGRAFCIWFSDWGPGIEEGMEDLIFQPGFREEKAVRSDASGQGIGLSIVRTIIAAHGGSIRLKSNRQPTTFEIVLPEALRQQPANPTHRI